MRCAVARSRLHCSWPSGMPRRKHVEIAGGGFAGLATATAFCHRGWTARIHEAAPELRSFGAGIFIWENGLRVLKALGAYDAVVAGAHEAPGYEGRDENNERMSLHHFGGDCRMLTMTRQHLYAAMLAAAQRAGVAFEISSEIVAADPTGALIGADGNRHEADLVVGADGVNSKVRQSLGVKTERTTFTHGVIRILVPRCDQDFTETNPDYVINFWGPRLKVLYTPCDANDLYLAMMVHKEDDEARAIPVNKKVWKQEIPHLAHIFDRIDDQGRFDSYEMTKLDRMSVGRAVLIGDSGPPMPPTLGQGAGCAIMNALGLAVAIDEAGDDLLDGLRVWEQRERPLTEHTQDISSLYVRNRAGSDGGNKWDAIAMRTARHIPTGTADIIF